MKMKHNEKSSNEMNLQCISWFIFQKVTFKAGHQLQFLFHSDSSNTEWGYKFTVTAFGLPDISVSWISDLQLLVSRLMGRLASRTMALKSTHGMSFQNYETCKHKATHLSLIVQVVHCFVACFWFLRGEQCEGASSSCDEPRHFLSSVEAHVHTWPEWTSQKPRTWKQ